MVIEDDLIRQTKSAVALSGKKMAQWVTDALRAALQAKKGRAA